MLEDADCRQCRGTTSLFDRGCRDISCFASGPAPRRSEHLPQADEVLLRTPLELGLLREEARRRVFEDVALRIYDERRLSQVGRGSPDQRPSMGQDMAKGRRTEIEYLNGFVVREDEQVGIQARANERLVDIVNRFERGELKQDPRHITELRLN